MNEVDIIPPPTLKPPPPPAPPPLHRRLLFRKRKSSSSRGEAAPSIPVLKKKWRILVVDDSAVCRKSTARILKLHEHYVDEADDGIECIFMVKMASDYYQEPYDAMICDDDMPQMTGHEATKILRTRGYDELRIIGLTGNRNDDVLQDFRNCGADIVIRKPLTEGMWIRIYESLIKETSLV